MASLPFRAAAIALAAATATATATATASTSPGGGGVSSSPVVLGIDFATFLPRSDPVWSWNASTSSARTLATEWVDALFGGNGALGFLVWAENPNSIRIDVSRTDVYDDRTPDMPQFIGNFVFDQPRLPVGHFELSWAGQLLAASGRIDLYNGVATLDLTTTLGSLGLVAWASAEYATADAMVFQLTSTGGEKWQGVPFVPEPAVSTWIGQDSRYVPNPPPANRSSVVAPELALPHSRGKKKTVLSNRYFPRHLVSAVSFSPGSTSSRPSTIFFD
jgi:hypothetical protein